MNGQVLTRYQSIMLDLILEDSNEELYDAITREVDDVTYEGRTHGRRATANQGCQGPLCKKVARDIARRKYAAKNPEVQRVRGERMPELDKLLDRIIEAHAEQRLAART